MTCMTCLALFASNKAFDPVKVTKASGDHHPAAQIGENNSTGYLEKEMENG